MISSLRIEWIKLRHNRYFGLLLIGTPAVCCVAAYLFANGVDVKSYPDQYIGWRAWTAILVLFFAWAQIVFIILGGIFVIEGQLQEHRDNTFKLYQIVPTDEFVLVQGKFYMYFLSCAFVFAFTLLLGVLVMEMTLIHRFPSLETQFEITSLMWSYLIDSMKVITILSFPVLLFVFMVSAKTTKASICFIVLIVVCISSFLAFPDWMFFRNTHEGLKIVDSLYGPHPLYTIHDLQMVYAKNILSSVVFLVIIYLMIKQKIFFSRSYERV